MQVPSLRGVVQRGTKRWSRKRESLPLQRPVLPLIHSLLGLSWPGHLGAQIFGRDLHNRSYSVMFNATPFDNHNSLRLSKVKGFAQGVQLLKSKARLLFIVSHHPLVPWVRWSMPLVAEKPQTRDRGVYQGQEVQRLASSVNQGSHRPGRCALTIRLGFCLQSNGRDWVPKKVADGQCNQFYIHMAGVFDLVLFFIVEKFKHIQNWREYYNKLLQWWSTHGQSCLFILPPMHYSKVNPRQHIIFSGNM